MSGQPPDFHRADFSDESILAQRAHRPWPLPGRSYFVSQEWRDLLFAHWPVAPQIVRRIVPEKLELDLRDGMAWLGIVPFRGTNMRFRNGLPVPGSMNFHELNVRTYVTAGGKPGVYFFSLDAASLPAVWGARSLYRLPYFWARMSVQGTQVIQYSSTRKSAPFVPNRGRADLQTSYQPTGERFEAKPGALAHWFAERYCLYTQSAKRAIRTNIHHVPWRLQPAQAEFRINTMAEVLGITLPDREPTLHFCGYQRTLMWLPERA